MNETFIVRFHVHASVLPIHPKYRNITLRELLRKLRCGEPIELLLLQTLDLSLIHVPSVARILDHPVGVATGSHAIDEYPRLSSEVHRSIFYSLVATALISVY